MANDIAKLRQALLALARGGDSSASAIRVIMRDNFDPTIDPSDPFNGVLVEIKEIANELDKLAIQCNEVMEGHDEGPSHSEIDPYDVIPRDFSPPVYHLTINSDDSDSD